MSDHAVEDLVEDSIRAVLASDLEAAAQRRLISELYGFQNRFDTSDTTGRLRDELQALGYSGRGDVRAGQALPLILRLMSLAEAQQALQLAHHWLAMLQRGLDEGDLLDDLPRDYATLLGDAASLGIRDTALRLELDRRKFRHGYLRLPGWSALKPFNTPVTPKDIERNAMLRWFSDLKTTPEKIEAERQKLLAAAAKATTSPFHRLPELDLLPQELRLIRRTDARGDPGFLFDLDARKEADGGRVMFHIEAAPALGCLVCAFWVISGQIARWQGRDPDAPGMPVHFRYNFFLKLPDAHITQSRWIHPMGGWKYRLSQPEKALRGAVSDMFLNWKLAAPLRRHHVQPLGDKVLSRGLDKTLADAVRLGNRYGFFRTDIEVMFACACHAIEQGADPGPAIARIAARLETIHPNNPLLPVWRDGHARLASGAIWFPPELSMIFAHVHL